MVESVKKIKGDLAKIAGAAFVDVDTYVAPSSKNVRPEKITLKFDNGQSLVLEAKTFGGGPPFIRFRVVNGGGGGE